MRIISLIRTCFYQMWHMDTKPHCVPICAITKATQVLPHWYGAERKFTLDQICVQSFSLKKKAGGYNCFNEPLSSHSKDHITSPLLMETTTLDRLRVWISAQEILHSFAKAGINKSLRYLVYSLFNGCTLNSFCRILMVRDIERKNQSNHLKVSMSFNKCQQCYLYSHPQSRTSTSF